MENKKESKADFTRRATEQSLQELRAIKCGMYKVSTSGDSRVCPACKAQEGKKYKVKDAMPGKNAPPFCDNCRCVILGVFDH